MLILWLTLGAIGLVVVSVLFCLIMYATDPDEEKKDGQS